MFSKGTLTRLFPRGRVSFCTAVSSDTFYDTNLFNINWDSDVISALKKEKFSWQQTMLRIKDPEKTIPFYENNFNMKIIHKYDFPDMKFTLYFVGSKIPGLEYPEVTSFSKDRNIIIENKKESEAFLWNYPGTVLELTHNHGDEVDNELLMCNGNQFPYRGFGHIAFNCNNVYSTCDYFMKNSNISFQKKPNQGRMKGLAFIFDPNEYWIELVKRGDYFGKKQNEIENWGFEYNLSQTMLRIYNPKDSLKFYCDLLQMDLLYEMHSPEGEFTNYFLGHITNRGLEIPNFNSPQERRNYVMSQFNPVLELTHNWNSDEKYHNGNTIPKGFGHIGFLCNNLEITCQLLQKCGIKFKKLPNQGTLPGIAFAYDPNGYWIELVQRGLTLYS